MQHLQKTGGVHPSSQKVLSLRAFPAVRAFKRVHMQTFHRVSRLSSFLSTVYGLSYTTGDTYLLFFQSLAHSFHRDGGCTPPSSHFGTRPLRIPRSPCPTMPLFFIFSRGTT